MALDDKDREYIQTLGLVNARRLLDDVDRGSGRSDRVDRGEELRSILSRMEFSTALVDVDSSVADRFAGAMSSVIQPVRLTGAVRDIVNPLYDRLKILNEERGQVETQRYIEQTMYSARMLEALNSINASAAGSGRGIYLAIREFKNAPILKSLRVAMTGLTAVTKFGFGLAFGFGKKKSDTDRIVDAINRQTEWHMTGQIQQDAGIFKRLISHGVIGTAMQGAGRLAMRGVGVSVERAQEVEDARSRGENVSNVGDIITRWVMRNRVTLKGRPGEGDANTVAGPPDPIPVYIIDRGLPASVHDAKSYEGMLSFHRNLIDVITGQSSIEHHSSTFMSDLMGDMLNVTELAYAKNVNQHVAVTSRIGQLIEHEDKKAEFAELTAQKQEKLDEKIVKWTKETRDEVRAHRRQTFWMSMMRIGSSLLSGVFKLAGSVGSILSGLAGGKFLKGLLKGRLPGGRPPGGRLPGGGVWDRIKGLGGKAVGYGGKFLKAGGIAGVGGLGLSLLGDHIGSDTKAGAGMKVGGSALSGASMGALAGSVIPGLGTLVGGIIGGVLGTVKGYVDNHETLDGVKRYPGTGVPWSTPNPEAPSTMQMPQIQPHPGMNSNIMMEQAMENILGDLKKDPTTGSQAEELNRKLIDEISKASSINEKMLENLNRIVENTAKSGGFVENPFPAFSRK